MVYLSISSLEILIQRTRHLHNPRMFIYLSKTHTTPFLKRIQHRPWADRPGTGIPHLGTGHGAFFHALHVTRTHDVLCHCKTYIALFSTHLTKISTWILNDCTETNEKFYLHSTLCIQGRKWKKICQVGSNKHENFT